MERLDKFLCDSGVGTRSQVKVILKSGRVTVDGKPEKDGSRKIDPAIHLVCLDGDRLEHTVANFQALQYLKDHGAQGTLVGLRQIVTLIQNQTIHFPARCEGDVSVFCLGQDARGVTIENLHYNVQDAVLTAGFPLGVSNHFVGKEAAVSVQEGSLLLIWERKNGLIR